MHPALLLFTFPKLPLRNQDSIRMYKKFICALMLAVPLAGFAQEEAVTTGGKTVLLFPDNTWKYKPLVVAETSVDSTLVVDSVATVVTKPEKHKVYNDTSTGFKGFMKPELKLPVLPQRSEGLYGFKVKVNKEGFVKEVVTILRGPNGDAEKVIRNTITRLKYLPDGSIVPPLTEGVIKVTVPPGH
jgi:hypothetical protein